MAAFGVSTNTASAGLDAVSAKASKEIKVVLMRVLLKVIFNFMVDRSYFSTKHGSTSVRSFFLKNNFLLNLVLIFTLTSCAHAAEFIRHSEDKPMQSYLAMNLSYDRYGRLLHVVEEHEHLHLKNRGEAHITVISPVEYDNVLKRHMNIEEINRIAEAAHIEQTPFQEVCIGRGQKVLQGEAEKTYFVVVKAPGLVRIREMVAAAFAAHGGHPQDFRPEIFFPHVTLGFTSRDLFFEDGVIKNESACIQQLPF